MNIIERGKKFLQSLQDLANRTIWDWKQCPYCGSMATTKYGTYTRYPWFLDGRKKVKVQRHECKPCDVTYSETTPLLKRGSWYAREVQSQCNRPLATWRDVVAADSRGITFVAGEAGAVSVLATAGGRAGRVGTLSSISEHGAPLVGSSGYEGTSERGGTA